MAADPYAQGSTSPIPVFGPDGSAQSTFEPEVDVKRPFAYINPFYKLETATPRESTQVSPSDTSQAREVGILRRKPGSNASVDDEDSSSENYQHENSKNNTDFDETLDNEGEDLTGDNGIDNSSTGDTPIDLTKKPFNLIDRPLWERGRSASSIALHTDEEFPDLIELTDDVPHIDAGEAMTILNLDGIINVDGIINDDGHPIEDDDNPPLENETELPSTPSTVSQSPEHSLLHTFLTYISVYTIGIMATYLALASVKDALIYVHHIMWRIIDETEYAFRVVFGLSTKDFPTDPEDKYLRAMGWVFTLGWIAIFGERWMRRRREREDGA